jgi:hypothetical protein
MDATQILIKAFGPAQLLFGQFAGKEEDMLCHLSKHKLFE